MEPVRIGTSFKELNYQRSERGSQLEIVTEKIFLFKDGRFGHVYFLKTKKGL